MIPRILTNMWLGALSVQLLLVIVLALKRTWRSYPAFSGYCLFGTLMGSGLYVFKLRSHSPLAYFYAYWISEAVSMLLGFVVIYEVFKNLIGGHPALARLAKLMVQWLLIFLIILGVAVIALRQVPVGQHPLSSAVLVMEEAARVIEVGLLLFLFLFSKAFGLHWRQQVFGIALGLGIFVAVELVGVTMQARYGRVAFEAFALTHSASFLCSLLIWLGYLLAPERVTSESELPKRAQLEQWNQAITELIHQ